MKPRDVKTGVRIPVGTPTQVFVIARLASARVSVAKRRQFEKLGSATGEGHARDRAGVRPAPCPHRRRDPLR